MDVPLNLTEEQNCLVRSSSSVSSLLPPPPLPPPPAPPRDRMAFRASAVRSAWTRVHFPRQTVTLVRSSGPDKGIFKVDPKMTKLEVREYLEKVYGLPVRKVNTTNYDGKLKRGSMRLPGKVFRKKAYKKAFVSFYELDKFEHVESHLDLAAGYPRTTISEVVGETSAAVE